MTFGYNMQPMDLLNMMGPSAYPGTPQAFPPQFGAGAAQDTALQQFFNPAQASAPMAYLNAVINPMLAGTDPIYEEAMGQQESIIDKFKTGPSKKETLAAVAGGPIGGAAVIGNRSGIGEEFSSGPSKKEVATMAIGGPVGVVGVVANRLKNLF